MARDEHLPIYKKALDVAVHFEVVVTGFSRYHKYTLGTELRNQSRAVVTGPLQLFKKPLSCSVLFSQRPMIAPGGVHAIYL